MNRAEKKCWAKRQKYELTKADYLSWLDNQLSYAKSIHIDQKNFLE